jgi:hypothetical protein
MDLSAPVPKIEISKGLPTTITIGDIRLTVISLAGRDFRINGKRVDVSGAPGLFELAQRIHKLRGKKRPASAWMKHAIPSAAAVVDNDCVSKWDRLGKDPLGVLGKGYMGYLPPIWIAGLYLEGTEYFLAYAARPSCKDQVEALRKILRANDVALQHFGCGADSRQDDSEAQLTFWTTDTEKLKKDEEEEEALSEGEPRKFKHKKREFHFDYAGGYVQENLSEREAKKAKADDVLAFEKDNHPYQYSATRYDRPHRVFRRKYNERGSSSCVTLEKDDVNFKKAHERLNPFAEFFTYLSLNRSCLSCDREIRMELEYKLEPPPYIRAKAKPLPVAPVKTEKAAQ